MRRWKLLVVLFFVVAVIILTAQQGTVALAETITALVLLVTAIEEGSPFLWTSEENTMAI